MSFYVWMMSVDYSGIERKNMAFSAWFFHISVAIADVAEVAGDSVPVIDDGGDHRKKAPNY